MVRLPWKSFFCTFELLKREKKKMIKPKKTTSPSTYWNWRYTRYTAWWRFIHINTAWDIGILTSRSWRDSKHSFRKTLAPWNLLLSIFLRLRSQPLTKLDVAEAMGIAECVLATAQMGPGFKPQHQKEKKGNVLFAVVSGLTVGVKVLLEYQTINVLQYFTKEIYIEYGSMQADWLIWKDMLESVI